MALLLGTRTALLFGTVITLKFGVRYCRSPDAHSSNTSRSKLSRCTESLFAELERHSTDVRSRKDAEGGCTFRAVHPQWTGTISVHVNGRYVSVNAGSGSQHAGSWSVNGDTLALAWDAHDPETLQTNDNGTTLYDGRGFELRHGSPPSWWRSLFVPAMDAWEGFVAFRQRLEGNGLYRGCVRLLVYRFARGRLPQYEYDAHEDCFFWAAFVAAAQRSIRLPDDAEVCSSRVGKDSLWSQPFQPRLRRTGQSLYIGGHKRADNALEFRRHHGGPEWHTHVFEPSRSYFATLRNSLANDSGVTLHNYGVSDFNGWAQLHMVGNRAHTISEAELRPRANVLERTPTQRIRIRSAGDVMRDFRDEHGQIDHVSMNCEGCEYSVVRHLHDSGLLGNVLHVEMQTHPLEFGMMVRAASLDMASNSDLDRFWDLSIRRYCETHRALARTHKLVWGVPFYNERWSLRST